ncbi:MAG: hypothetical protein LUI87_07045 [Lachnospiraceae bacterium]|nr:hypothetical protein [Lachnospiraceae bacterium]
MEIINMRSIDDTCLQPKITEIRYTDYKHTGVRLQLATIVLGIPPDANILDGSEAGKDKIRNAITTYFCDYHTPSANGKDIFLPVEYPPAAAALAIDNIRRGDNKGTAVETYIMRHSGPLVIDLDSVYVNYKARSWLAKIWYVYCDDNHCDTYLF